MCRSISAEDVQMLRDAHEMTYETAGRYGTIFESSTNAGLRFSCCDRKSYEGERVLFCQDEYGRGHLIHLGDCPKGEGVLDGAIVRELRQAADDAAGMYYAVADNFSAVGVCICEEGKICAHCGEQLPVNAEAMKIESGGAMDTMYIHRHSCPVIITASYRSQWDMEGADPVQDIMDAQETFESQGLNTDGQKDRAKEIIDRYVRDTSARLMEDISGKVGKKLPKVGKKQAGEIRWLATEAVAYYSDGTHACSCCGKLVPRGVKMIIVEEKMGDPYFIHWEDCDATTGQSIKETKTCPECFGTGYVNGFGMPCSKGCGKERQR